MDDFSFPMIDAIINWLVIPLIGVLVYQQRQIISIRIALAVQEERIKEQKVGIQDLAKDIQSLSDKVDGFDVKLSAGFQTVSDRIFSLLTQPPPGK